MSDKKVIMLAEYRVPRKGLTPEQIAEMDKIVMTNLAAAGMLINMVSLYFLDAGFVEFGEKIGRCAGELGTLCKNSPVSA